jgi:fructoselysine 6-kinase
MTAKTAPLQLLALTPCCVDYYPQTNKSFMGGNSLNVASMWCKLEPHSSISVITCLGDDENGRRILDFFTKKGIAIGRVYIREGKTASNQLRVDESGERFGIEGAWQGGVYETFILSDDDWEWVARQDIVAMPGNNPNFQAMLRKKHANQLLSVDYLDVSNNTQLEETVALTDIAFISANSGLLPHYRELAFSLKKLVIVTLGASGSYAFYDGISYFQPAIEIPRVVDTTGCGDAYQAAFALTYYRTKEIQESMNAGAIASAEIAQAWGGVGKTD